MADSVIDAKTEYLETLQYLKHHQSLIHGSLSTYVAISAPLIAVGMSGGIAATEPFRLPALGLGLAVSVVWFLIAKRLSAYNRIYIGRLEQLEGNTPGLLQKNAVAQKNNVLLRGWPGHSNLILFVYGAGMFGFASALLCVALHR